MSENIKLEVKEAILDSNDKIAEDTKSQLSASGVFAINVMGAPGAGKTSSIIAIIKSLNSIKSYVVEGDIESDIDTKTLKALGIDTIQINTHGACHLDAPTISKTLERFQRNEPGVMFIENIGNLVCPAEFSIGEHIKMLVVTVTEGSDKPYKYPLAFEKADLIILNKVDLIPYVDFDEEFFMNGIRALNPSALVVKVSARNNTGFKEVIEWIEKKAKQLVL